MKGSTKLLIVAAALLVAGILLSAIGYGLGAMTLTWGEDGLTIDPTQRAGIGLAALDLQEDILPSGAKTEIDIRLDGAVRELEVEGSVGSIADRVTLSASRPLPSRRPEIRRQSGIAGASPASGGPASAAQVTSRPIRSRRKG